MEKGKLFRLDDGWVSVAIDNLDSLHDVGYLHFDFLKKVLPHCTKDQLIHIEESTKDVDLTPIANNLWKKFFEREFGFKATQEAIKNANPKWSELYQDKLKKLEEAEEQVGERLKSLYQKEAARKQSRQIRVLDKPPSSFSRNKRSCSSKGSKLMNKVRKDYRNSLEVRNIEAMKLKRTANCSSLTKKPRTNSVQATNVF
ncbi:uncharacterized protein LOC126802309 [Argentina anserina]|uniref:uncharacterized protein LOC126802309 n=1 Tax=Argentina anserina TaxID=57926 RepID=UPI0021768F02|nr:uncharacterized protein LOC126802309 [Potentilla anserina]